MTTRAVWAGKYAVFDEIAAGGMASVYLACRLGPGESARVVAVKKLYEQFAKQPEFVTMFLDEAHLAARIRHPNVVNTYEFLRIPDSLAIVMEFVLGASLVDLAQIGHERRLIATVPVTARILCDTLEGLHAAHEATDDAGKPFEIVHRDVSPHNILVGKDGVSRVIDFGIAKAAGRLQVTEVGVMKGKFAYMAPEQIRAGKVDRRADVYSSGIVLWEALTGRALFRGSADAELFGKRGDGKVRVAAPSTVNVGLSRALDAVTLRALEIEPGKRFATTREMAEALAAAVPLASADEVAAWVASLAGSRIRELEARRNEVETSYAAGELAGLGSKPAPSLPSVAPAPAPASFLADLEVPELMPRSGGKPAPSKPDAGSTRETPPPSGQDPARASPTSFAPGRGAPASGASFGGSPFSPGADFDDPYIPDSNIDLDIPRPSPPRLSSPSLDVRAHSDSSAAPFATRGALPRSRNASSPYGQTRGRASGFVIVLGLLAVVALAGLKLAPTFLRSAVVDAAARRGLLLSVDGIEPRGGGLTLTGVTLSPLDVSEIALRAPVIDVALDWQGSLQKVSVPGYELTLRGNANDLGAKVAAWRGASHVPLACEAKAGHLVWPDAVVAGGAMEGIDVSLAVGAESEGSVHVDVPSLTITLARGSLGPWRARLDSTADETKLSVLLDRAKEDGSPKIELVARPKLGRVLSATIPRAKAMQIGVPAELLHAGPDPEIELALEGQVLPTGQPVTAHARVSLFGVPMASAGPTSLPVDLVLEGSIAGDSSAPLHIELGSLAVGKVKSRLTGLVTFASDGIRFEVDRPVAKAAAAPAPFVFDTREWTTGPDLRALPTATTVTSVASPPSPAKRR